MDTNPTTKETTDMNTNTTAQSSQVYRVDVPGFALSTSGAIQISHTKTFWVSEEASIFGGMRAVNQACDQADQVPFGWVRASQFSPDLTPNPAALGWVLGTATAR